MPNATAVVTATVLNLRLDASIDHPPVGRLPRGTRVEILERHGAWYRVDSPDGEGFVHGDFVVLLDLEPAVGFLHERPELHDIPLEVSEADRLNTGPGSSFKEGVVARTWNGKGGLLGVLSDVVSVADAASVAVLIVESSGSGFGNDGRLKIRFENHVFWLRWGRDHPDVFDRHFRFDPSRRWQGHRFRVDEQADWEEFHDRGQTGEWRAFEHARALDEHAALCSISMGASQVMGFNHHMIGYGSPLSMFDRFREHERFHILGLFDFIKGAGSTSPMLEALRRRQFTEFATHYNGNGQAAMYGASIREYFTLFEAFRGA